MIYSINLQKSENKKMDLTALTSERPNESLIKRCGREKSWKPLSEIKKSLMEFIKVDWKEIYKLVHG